MTGEPPIGDDDLQAFVDERLDPARRQAVEAFLAEYPALAARVASDRAHRDALRERLAFKSREPVPARLRVAHLRAEGRRIRLRRLASAAAALAWLVVGGALGWAAHDRFGEQRSAVAGSRPAAGDAIARDALAAHRVFVAEVAHPVEVGAAQEQHLVQWLSKRLGRPLRAPDLNGFGLRLMGGRLLPAGGEAAAQFMYEDERGARLTLYVRTQASDETAFRFAQARETSAFYWIDDGLGYVVSAALDREGLLPIAEAIHRALDASDPPRRTTL